MGSGYSRVVSVSAGSRHAVLVTSAGLAYAFGAAGPWLGVGPSCSSPHPEPTRILFPTPVLVNGVSCGKAHTALTTTGGRVLTCGKAEFGRLGLPAGVISRSSDPSCAVPQVAPFPPGPSGSAWRPPQLSVTATGFANAGEAIRQQREARGRSGDEDDPEWTTVSLPEPEPDQNRTRTDSDKKTAKKPRRRILLAAGSMHTFVSTTDVAFY
ncbi:hypothetical protein TrRE_jg10556 [Triparma retinervis]|uniref:Uncharacterized protein n=1 Tax=Triparma retinervis TaxID=2557542 RepID=A0A9W7C8D2_9STRA|nr:hypothetical protein TrRE_jg10556 [Triparma retinervis]